jgi:hypothetical protein
MSNISAMNKGNSRKYTLVSNQTLQSSIASTCSSLRSTTLRGDLITSTRWSHSSYSPCLRRLQLVLPLQPLYCPSSWLVWCPRMSQHSLMEHRLQCWSSTVLLYVCLYYCLLSLGSVAATWVDPGTIPFSIVAKICQDASTSAPTTPFAVADCHWCLFADPAVLGSRCLP